MSNEQFITIRGRLTNDPELRFTPSGAAVANFTVASNARTFDKQSNEWKDKEAIFWRCSAWKDLGENVAESLVKGVAVVVLAELESRSYTTKDGDNRTVTEARVESIGPDLRWATAKVTRAQRSGGAQQGQQSPAQNWNQQSTDPWATPAPTSDTGWGNGDGPNTSEPPF